MRRALVLLCVALLMAGCGAGAAKPAKLRRVGESTQDGIPASLLAGARPIGAGPRFRLPARGPVPGPCRAQLGPRRQAHVELFGANRVLLLAKGIGTRAPRRFRDGRLTHAACFGALVTLDQTGIVYVRPGSELTVADLFRAWGQELSATRIASFRGGRTIAYVDGVRWRLPVGRIPLRAGAEIVIEIGPHVPPHTRFLFPPAPAADMR